MPRVVYIVVGPWVKRNILQNYTLFLYLHMMVGRYTFNSLIGQLQNELGINMESLSTVS